MSMTEIQKKWVAALRSGNYKQTTSKLHGDSGFCCLGVAADLAVKKFPNIYSWEFVNDQTAHLCHVVRDTVEHDLGDLPISLCEMFGINYLCSYKVSPGKKEILSEIITKGCGKTFKINDSFKVLLISLNDSGVPFTVIADVIEEFFKDEN